MGGREMKGRERKGGNEGAVNQTITRQRKQRGRGCTPVHQLTGHCKYWQYYRRQSVRAKERNYQKEQETFDEAKNKKNTSYVTLYLFVSPSLSPFFLSINSKPPNTHTYRQRERERVHSYNTAQLQHILPFQNTSITLKMSKGVETRYFPPSLTSLTSLQPQQRVTSNNPITKRMKTIPPNASMCACTLTLINLLKGTHHQIYASNN